ncbi:MAG: anthranilate phosphoribosyltransferase [Gammaproteobacteria bacterium]|nr:anthranilate phosphoribosyltransferase [Gammaproteobacteria bacterium]
MTALTILEALMIEDLPLDEQVSFLEALNRFPITGELLYEAVKVVRRHSKVDLNESMEVLDIVGTGGDCKGLFNISTTAAFILAGAGVPVIKHGNVGVSSRSGAVDVLRALHVNLPKNMPAVYHDFQEVGIAFVFAAYFHPHWAKFKAARQVLAARGERTLFNLLGPLANPFNPKYQAIGVYDSALVEPFAEALALLGHQGMVFSSEGCDELILTDQHHIFQVRRGLVQKFDFSLAELGLKSGSVKDLLGGDPACNADMMERILNNQERGPKRDVALLNALMGLLAYQPEWSITDAWARLERSLESGMAALKLKRLQEI